MAGAQEIEANMARLTAVSAGFFLVFEKGKKFFGLRPNMAADVHFIPVPMQPKGLVCYSSTCSAVAPPYARSGGHSDSHDICKHLSCRTAHPQPLHLLGSPVSTVLSSGCLEFRRARVAGGGKHPREKTKKPAALRNPSSPFPLRAKKKLRSPPVSALPLCF